MKLNALALELNSWLRCANVSKLCAPILSQVRSYIAAFGAPWCPGFLISSSTLHDRNVSLYSLCFTTRAIPQSGLVARTVPANHRIDTDRFAAGHAGR
jgi:hypothetical protein